MTARLDYRTELPDAIEAMSGLEKVVESSTLELLLVELVKQRASQINGCAYCLDMHTKDAVAMGEDEQRLYLVPVWREAPFFTPRERAALAWTEALTLLPETGAPDDVYEAMAPQFDPAEQVALTLAIVAINGWNRFSVGFRRPVGSYVSGRHPEPGASRGPRRSVTSDCSGPTTNRPRATATASWWTASGRADGRRSSSGSTTGPETSVRAPNSGSGSDTTPRAGRSSRRATA